MSVNDPAAKNLRNKKMSINKRMPFTLRLNKMNKKSRLEGKQKIHTDKKAKKVNINYPFDVQSEQTYTHCIRVRILKFRTKLRMNQLFIMRSSYAEFKAMSRFARQRGRMIKNAVSMANVIDTDGHGSRLWKRHFTALLLFRALSKQL